MADINFSEEQLKEWFQNVYLTPTNRGEYDGADDARKTEIMTRAIAEERRKRLLDYSVAEIKERSSQEVDSSTVEQLMNQYIVTEANARNPEKNASTIDDITFEEQDEILKDFAESAIQRENTQNETPIITNQDENSAKEIEDAVIVEEITDENSKKEENIENNQKTDEPTPPQQEDGKQLNQEEVRVRSLTSDANEFEVDKLRVATLQDMGKVSAEDVADLTPQKAIEIINSQVPELSEEELKDMESRLTSKILDGENQEIFNTIPPKLLAQKYEEVNETLSSENASEEEKQLATTRKEKLSKRIDDLTDQFVDQGQTQDGLFFVDNTNIADVKEGYDAMFVARTKDLQQIAGNASEGEMTPERDAAQQRISKMGRGSSMLQEAMDKYEADNHIADLNPENAEDLDKRFDQIQETFKEVTLDDETMKLVSNFKFTNEAGEPEPQFEYEDASGNKVQSHEIPDGAKNVKIIEGSKLDIAVQLAKQDATMDALGTKEEITKESLQEKLGDSMTATLFSMHTTSQVIDGVLESPDHFTNPKNLEEFKTNLANPEKPIKVNPVAFEAGVDNIVNQTAGYATALGNKVGKDKPVVTKLFNPIENIDKRAGDRYTETGRSKREVRIEMLKRSAKGFATAFVVSGAITTLGTMASADASLTAATGGLNKLAGMAVGVGLAAVMTYKQLKAWNKKQTAEGKPKGFWNRCKQLLTDRKMAMTLGTTALGAAALGFAATGNPGVASAIGMGAMALGMGNGLISNYQDCKKNGLGTLESCGWGAVMAASTLAGGLAGRWTANTAIDWYNDKYPENELFQHKETKTTTEIKESRKFEEGTHEASAKTLKTMYTDENGHFHEAKLQAQIDENIKFIDDNKQIFQDRGYNLDDPTQKLALAEKMELTKIALGENTGVNTAQHIDGGGVKYSHGNHYTMTDKVLAADGFLNPAQAKADFMDMFNSNDPNAIARGLDSFEKINIDVLGKHNEINFSDSQTMAGSHHDGVLHRDAVVGEDGKLHVDWEKGTEYNTYVEGKGTLRIIPDVVENTETTMVRNDRVDGLGTFGILGNYINPIKKLKDRIGAFADKIMGKKKKEDPQPTPVPPVIKKEQKLLPAQTQKKIAELRGRTTPTLLLEVKPAKEEVKIEEKGYGKLLADEYKIIYGVAPQVVDRSTPEKPDRAYKSWIAYNNRVDAERQATGRDISMYDFLTERRQALDSMIENIGNTHTVDTGIVRDNRGVVTQDKVVDGQPKNEILAKADYEKHKDNPAMAAIIADTRQGIMQSNISSQNYSTRMTLTHFMDYMSEHIAKTDFVADGTRDTIKFNKEKLKRDIQNQEGDNRHFVADLNDVYFPKKEDGKTFSERKEAMFLDPDYRVPARDVWKKMVDIHNAHDPAVQAQRTASRYSRQ